MPRSLLFFVAEGPVFARILMMGLTLRPSTLFVAGQILGYKVMIEIKEMVLKEITV